MNSQQPDPYAAPPQQDPAPAPPAPNPEEAPVVQHAPAGAAAAAWSPSAPDHSPQPAGGYAPVAGSPTHGGYAAADGHPAAGAYPPPGAYAPPGGYPPAGAHTPPGGYPDAGGYGPPPPGWGPSQAAGYPPAPQGPGRPAASGAAVTALVLGCSGLLLSFIPFVGVLGIVLGIAAIILGVVGLRKATAGAGGRGMAVGGLATGVAAILVGIAVSAGTWWLTLHGEDLFGPGWLDEGWDEEWEDAGSSWRLDRYERSRLDNAVELGPDDPYVIDDVIYRLRSVDLDADEAVRSADRWAGAPEGRYVLVELDVTYEGPYDFEPSVETWAYVVEDDTTGHADWCESPGTDLYEQEPLGPGETATVMLCFDLPVESLDRMRLVVDSWDEDIAAGVWRLAP